MKKSSVIKTSFNLIKGQFLQLVIAVTIIKVMSLSLLKFVSGKVFQLMLLEANIQGLSNDNFMRVLVNPWAILFLFSWVSLICLFMIAEVLILTLTFNRPFTSSQLTLKSFANKIKSLIKPSFVWFVLYILIVMPNMNLGVSASFATQVKLPKFIIDFFFEQTWLTVLYFIGLSLLFLFNLFLFYAPTIFVLEDLSFIEACRKSVRLARNNLKSLVRLLISVSLVTFLISAGAGLFVHLITDFLKLVLPADSQVFQAMSNGVLFVVIGIVVSFSQIFINQVIVVSYHELSNSSTELTIKNKETVKLNKWVLVTLVIGFIISSIGFYYFSGAMHLPSETQIISHRGDTQVEIENTLEALESAATLGVDFVEMDVQLTKDGGLVVYHDFSYKRLAKDNRSVANVTLDEAMTFTLRQGNKSSRIPSFEEYMTLTKSLDQKILIELKQERGNNPRLNDAVVKVVQDLEMEAMVYYQSLNKPLVLDLKQRYPKTVAGYILGFNIGNLEHLNVDFYSLEASAVTQKVVTTLELWNKGLFVWTVNQAQDMKTFLRMGVNGIITDNEARAIYEKELVPQTSLSDLLWEKLP